ncbi:GntR family transcriptional regulator [Streptantibioticus ferralitis]|uniref:GntR family transcriptional regulator n=1 Tax=Streptantibioticus ferralitis TaxID=236510 RepID=A0ABT5YWL8_9ACTN|nr:GntR family transcriptional regulator [Streptantibioticus ferralitis]MDF2255868.1 GntR family transcriptional regulator [Streptantibioticus ferralitis]
MKYLPVILSTSHSSLNATERAYLAIKRRIIELELEPGAHVTKTDLTHLAGVGAMPVREALTRLQRDGLVQALPRSGYRILPVTLKGARELCAFRQLLETEAAGLAAKLGCPDDDLARMEELLKTTYELGNAESVNAFLRSNFEFDAIIANRCGNDMLAQSIIRVFDELERILRITLKSLAFSASAAHERQAILDAIRERDPAAAREAMEARTRASQDQIINALISSSSIAEASIRVS